MNKTNEQVAWEQLAKMDSKMLDELLAGVCTDVKTHVQMVEKYYSKTDDCEEMEARVYEYMKRALCVDKRWEVEEHIYACYKAGTWKAWCNQIGLQEYLESIADAPYHCEYFVQERGSIFYEMGEDGKWLEYECGPRVELYILAPDEYLDVIDEMGEDGKAYRFCIAVKEDEDGKLMERGYEGLPFCRFSPHEIETRADRYFLSPEEYAELMEEEEKERGDEEVPHKTICRAAPAAPQRPEEDDDDLPF